MSVPPASKRIYTLAVEQSWDSQRWLPQATADPVQVQFWGYNAWESRSCTSMRTGSEHYLLKRWCFVTSDFLANSPLTVTSPPSALVLRISHHSPFLWLGTEGNVCAQVLQKNLYKIKSLSVELLSPGAWFLGHPVCETEEGESWGVMGLMPLAWSPCASPSWAGVSHSLSETLRSGGPPSLQAFTARTVPCGMWFLMWEAVYWGLLCCYLPNTKTSMLRKAKALWTLYSCWPWNTFTHIGTDICRQKLNLSKAYMAGTF